MIARRDGIVYLTCVRFCGLQKPIRKALVDAGEGLNINDEELRIVLEIVDALKPVKAAVEAICGRDANLLTADDGSYRIYYLPSQENEFQAVSPSVKRPLNIRKELVNSFGSLARILCILECAPFPHRIFSKLP